MRASSLAVACSALLAGVATAKPFNGEPMNLAPRQANSTCYSGVYVIYARGTFEPQNHSLSNIVADAIVAKIPGSASNQVQYPADVESTSVGMGIADTQKQVYDYYKACPDGKTVLMGYSQGAFVVGAALSAGMVAPDGLDMPSAMALSHDAGKNGESTQTPSDTTELAADIFQSGCRRHVR